MKSKVKGILQSSIPFIENKGQIKDKDILYYARTSSHGSFTVENNGDMVYFMPKSEGGKNCLIRESFTDNTLSAIQGENPSLTNIHYLIGDNPDAWIKNIPTYDIVHLLNVYKGIDIKLRLHNSRMEKVFFVQPGGDPSSIKITVTGVRQTKLNINGELGLETDAGQVHCTKPLAYQDIKGQKRPVDVAYELTEDGYSFKVGTYDKQEMLVIDPILAANFLGGDGEDFVTSIALDSADEFLYAAGYTNSSIFSRIESPLKDLSSITGFVVKLDADLLTASDLAFVGGSADTHITDIKLFPNGADDLLYVAGDTKSRDLPGATTGADNTFSGSSEAFVAELPSDLSSVDAATFLGGDNDESVKSLAIDKTGNLYVTGFTGSADFPGITENSADKILNTDGIFKGNFDGFVAKLNPGLDTIFGATFIGGSDDDIPLAIALDTLGDIGQYSSIALDSNEKIHLSYYDATTQSLKYATNASGSWVTETVDSTSDVAQYSSIAVDSSMNVHISYYDTTDGYLKYATNATGSWITSTVDNSSNVGQYSSIAVDSDKTVHISYYDATLGDLKYAFKTSTGSWPATPDIVDSTGDVGQFSSIAVDSDKTVHISYYDATLGDLKYAFKTSTGSWPATPDVVDSTGDVGQFSSIAVDSDKTVHISYYDATLGDLKYAFKTSTGSWPATPDVVDSTGNVGQFSSIAVDSDKTVHISYYDATLGDLKYAFKTSTGSWPATPDVVDSTGNVGQFSSIAAGSSGNIYISYYDATLSDLRYATEVSGSWTTDTIMNVYVTGWTRSSDLSGIDSSSADADIENFGIDGFVAKFDANLMHVKSTFLGGSDDDIVQALAVDNTGNVYVAGYTSSADFPITTGAADSEGGGYIEGFVAELSPDLSSILAATYLGGSDNDIPEALALNSIGDVIVSGYTQSLDFVGINSSSADSTFGGYYEGFVASLNYNLTSVISATYLGGSDYDNAFCLAVNSSDDLYVAGWTYSTDIFDEIFTSSPAKNTFSDMNEGFVVKLGYGLTKTAMGFIKNRDSIIASGSDYRICWDKYTKTSSFRVMYSANNGRSWKTLQKALTDTCYAWNVPILLRNASNCLVKIIEYAPSGKKIGERKSRTPFLIEVVSVVSPDEGEDLASGTLRSIVWKTAKTKHPVETAYIYYNQDGKNKWKLIGSLPGNPEEFTWTVPPVTTAKNTYRIKVVLKDARRKTVATAISDHAFTIRPR